MKRLLSLLLAAVMLIGICGCGKNKQKFTEYSFDYFDTVTTIVGFETSKDNFDKVVGIIKAELETYHKLYNIYTAYEGVNNLVAVNSADDEITVDSKITRMLAFAKEMYYKTDGKVNVAMGSVLKIWHNHRESGISDPKNATLPEMQKLKAAALHTDIEKLVINAETNTVLLTDTGMCLDVGAIAKGYAVEQIAQSLKKQGIGGYIINVGGNIRTVGSRADGGKWLVGIENPNTENTDEPYIAYLEIDNASVVTSGSYQRYYTVDGRRYHHIIDPETLMPGENFVSVSLVCKDSGMGDAFSTALFSMTFEEGLALAEKTENLEAMWVLPNGEKRFSSGFEKYMKKDAID